MLSSQRHLFSIPEDVAYFNCAYLSPQLKSVSRAGHEGIAVKDHPWQVTPEDFFGSAEIARKLAGKLFCVSNEHFAILPSVSYGIQIAANNLPLGVGEEILLLEDQFPSNVYPWLDLAKRKGGKIVVAPRGTTTTTAGKSLVDFINQRTSIVALAPCHWTDGSLVDLKAVDTASQRVGANLVIDATQSAGAMPLDLSELNTAFMVTASYKWLLGPYGSALMYVNPEWQHGNPLEENWLNREGSENFAELTNYRDGYQQGARRYDVGQRSNIVQLNMINAALEQILIWGVDNIHSYIQNLNRRVIDKAEQLGIIPSVGIDRASHIVGLQAKDGIPNDWLESIKGDSVFLSQRASSIRVAPHLYNTDADLTKLFTALESL